MAKKKNRNISKNIPNGTILHTRDEYIYGSKSYRKPGYVNKGNYRKVGVIDSNKNDDLAVVNTGQSAPRPVLPFWAPFWIFEAVFFVFFNPFIDLFYRYRYMRSDNTVILWYAHTLIAKTNDIYKGVCNTFGSIKVSIDVESGRMDGERKAKFYYKNIKKIRSERYGTACLSAMFERYAEINQVGIEDMECYADKMAAEHELLKQHSYMQDDIYNAQRTA